MGHAVQLTMLQFNSTGLGTVTPLGFYAGYLLAASGNLWIAGLFLAVTCLSVFLTSCSLCRLVLNCRRHAHAPFSG